ncbi:MAG: type II CAAX endopeptidase family protein [Candidatus Acidiferrales bacterium]
MATTILAADPQPNPERKLIAPLWHTIVFVLFIIGYAYSGRTTVPRIEGMHLHSKVTLYLLMIFLELALVSYVWFLGVKPAGGSFRGLIGGKWNTFADVLRDIGVAFLFWLVVIVMLVGLQFSMGKSPETAKAVFMLAPGSLPEMIVWVILAVTAGFCEEFVFRGYLQKQFHAITGSDAAAVAMQAVCFGIAHSYQGVKSMVTITAYGALFGILAIYRKSLRPGMIQHAMQDSFSGLGIALLKRLGKLPSVYF